jgi:hypothetical protein
VALILICPLTAGAIAGILGMTTTTALGTAATALGWIAFAATIAQATFDGVAMGTGKESWVSFALDLTSLATFGLGEGASTLIKTMAKGAEDAGKAVAAGRAGRAFMIGQGLPGILFSVGSRSSSAAKILDWLGQGEKLQGSIGAANETRSEITKALKEAEPSNLVALWSMNGDIAEHMAKFTELSEKVPGVLRIVVPRAAAAGLMTTEGGGQWATFAGGNAYSITQWTAGSDQAEINQTITHFRQALSRVP